jgi:hypothetical protein
MLDNCWNLLVLIKIHTVSKINDLHLSKLSVDVLHHDRRSRCTIACKEGNPFKHIQQHNLDSLPWIGLLFERPQNVVNGTTSVPFHLSR